MYKTVQIYVTIVALYMILAPFLIYCWSELCNCEQPWTIIKIQYNNVEVAANSSVPTHNDYATVAGYTHQVNHNYSRNTSINRYVD